MSRFGKIFMVLSIMVLIVLSGSVLAGADCFYGTGLFEIPTADVMSKGSLNIGLYQGGGNTELSFVLGVSDDFEVSLGFAGISGGSSRSAYGLKGRILSETKDSIGLAIGVINNSAYVVAGKRLDIGGGVRGHLGVSLGANPGPFVAVEKLFNPVTVSRQGSKSFNFPPTIGIIEYSQAGLIVGVRFLFTSDFSVDLSFDDAKTLVLGGSFKLDM